VAGAEQIQNIIKQTDRGSADKCAKRQQCFAPGQKIQNMKRAKVRNAVQRPEQRG